MNNMDLLAFVCCGDEFALLTDSTDISYAQEIAEKLKSSNEQTFSYDSSELPLSLHIGITQLSKSPLRYNELFTELHMTIKESK